MPVEVCESTVQRIVQKHDAAVCPLLPCQSVSGEKDASQDGITRDDHARWTKNEEKEQKYAHRGIQNPTKIQKTIKNPLHQR